MRAGVAPHADGATAGGWQLRFVRASGLVEISCCASAAERRRSAHTRRVAGALLSALLCLLPLPYMAAAQAAVASLGCDPALRAALPAACRLCLLAALWLLLPQPVVQESVLAGKGFGCQLTTVRADGSSGHRFVDIHNIKALVVNEGIHACGVRYYLAMSVAGHKRLLLLFDRARPRLPVLAKIYRTLHVTLFPEQHVDTHSDEFYERQYSGAILDELRALIAADAPALPGGEDCADAYDQ